MASATNPKIGEKFIKEMTQKEQEQFKQENDTKEFIDWFYHKMASYKKVSRDKLVTTVKKYGHKKLVDEMIAINNKLGTKVNDNLIIAKANGIFGVKIDFLQEPPIPIEEPDFFMENGVLKMDITAKECIELHDFSVDEIKDYIIKNDIPNGKLIDVINLMYDSQM